MATIEENEIDRIMHELEGEDVEKKLHNHECYLNITRNDDGTFRAEVIAYQPPVNSEDKIDVDTSGISRKL